MQNSTLSFDPTLRVPRVGRGETPPAIAVVKRAETSVVNPVVRRRDGVSPRRRVAKIVADYALSALISVVAPTLRRFAEARGSLPRSSARADAAGISVVTHHYYSPAITERDLRHPLDQPRVLSGVDLDPVRQAAFLEGLDFGDELRAFPLDPPSRTEYGFRNGLFESGDAEVLYGIIRRDKPRRIIEIGSGWSTLMAARAVARNRADDAAYTCEHICIEPYEMPWLESIGVTVLRERVEQVDLTLFDRLEAGDILFVDSSHVVRPQGDVLREVAEIYPRLKPGVLVQIHDIFTPRDYPHRWVIEERRIWNEQYLLEAFLCDNQRYEIVCALNWLANDHRDLLRKACPILLDSVPNQPGSFWMRRRAVGQA